MDNFYIFEREIVSALSADPCGTTSAASRCMNSSGDITRCVVPSRRRVRGGRQRVGRAVRERAREALAGVGVATR